MGGVVEHSGKTKGKTVAIAGAGIVGISTAIWLQRAGYDVVVIDREGPAGGTSYGNAGVLASGSIVPVTVPGLWKKAPGMLLDKSSPLFMRWSYFPKLVPFLWRYMSHANERAVEPIADGLWALLHDAADQHLALAKGTEAECFVEEGDYVFAYANKVAFEADRFGWELRRKRDVPFEEMSTERLAEYDPVLTEQFGYAVRCPHHGRVSDPGAYVKALARQVEKDGGTFVKTEIKDVVLDGNVAKGFVTSQGEIKANHLVIATGAWSRNLMQKLGLDVPMESERGYHVEFVNPSVVPRSPTMVASGKFVMTPMEGRLRCAGIVEFGGLDAPPSEAPYDLLINKTLELLKDLKYDRIEKWMGHRPSTVDSLPVIGNLGEVENVWPAFGHQHVGLTAGPKTGRWIAQLIDGDIPNFDLAIFSPKRFNTSRAE